MPRPKVILSEEHRNQGRNWRNRLRDVCDTTRYESVQADCKAKDLLAQSYDPEAVAELMNTINNHGTRSSIPIAQKFNDIGFAFQGFSAGIQQLISSMHVYTSAFAQQ